MSNGHNYLNHLETELDDLHLLLADINNEVVAYSERPTFIRHPSQAEPYLLRIRDYIEDYQRTFRQKEANSWKKDNG